MSIHKYSDKIIAIIDRELSRPEFLTECKEEYSKTFLQGKSRKKPKFNGNRQRHGKQLF